MSEEYEDDQQRAYEEDLARYKACIEERKMLHEALVKVSERFTQWSLTLSGGALALSITYVEKLSPAINSNCGLLIGSWVLLATSIVSNLFSLHCSCKATLKAIELSDQQLINWRKDPKAVFATAVNSSSEWTARLSMASLLSFAGGISLFCLFVYLCPPSVRAELTPDQYGQTTYTSATPGPTPHTNADLTK